MKPHALQLNNQQEQQLTLTEMMSLKEEEVKKLLSEYYVFKKERERLQKEALLSLPAEPTLLLDCIHYIRVNGGLHESGIFRVNGDLALLSAITETYKTNTDMNDILLSFQQKGKLKAFDVASTMKSYFRSLRDPLVPIASYEEIKELVDSPPENVDALAELYKHLHRIPEPNKSIFAFTMMFFQEVIENEDENQMNAYNLSTCLTMSVMRFNASSTNAILAVMEVQLSTQVLQVLLLKVDFKLLISKKKYFKLLKATKYRSEETLPRTYKQFLKHPMNKFK